MGRGIQVGGEVKLPFSEERSRDWADAREARAARRAARREERARERAALRGLPRRERLRVWWRTRPLGVIFTVCLTGYLAVATTLTLAVVELLSTWNNGYYEVEVTLAGGRVRRGVVDSGPYIYDPDSRQLLPASELDLPGDEALAVFIATGERGVERDYAPEGSRVDGELYATIDMVRSGQIRLYDWGLNYNDWYSQEEVLETNNSISADELARYDKLSRTGRVQSVELFSEMTGVDLGATFGEGLVSNTAYYAASPGPEGLWPWVLTFAIGMTPVIVYGGLGWIVFRRFYRVHVAAPLGEMAGAAERIAAGNLDFCLEPVRGRELGRLSRTLEGMRASLLEAQRELWRTAEGRRRLNAAFAHDLRTPVTVLKGTIEMARMRLGRGDAVDERELATLAAQAARLERYAAAMGGLTKLEDRPVERVEVDADEVVRELQHHASDVVAARGSDVRLVCEGDADAGSAGGGERAGVSADAAAAAKLQLDMPLVEEVLDNVLGNACGHARSAIALRVQIQENVLTVCVIDDGPGFSPEALRRGCDPFYSEHKSAEHFGLGLNVSSILCELHGGTLALGNDDGGSYGGAAVTATFAA